MEYCSRVQSSKELRTKFACAGMLVFMSTICTNNCSELKNIQNGSCEPARKIVSTKMTNISHKKTSTAAWIDLASFNSAGSAQRYEFHLTFEPNGVCRYSSSMKYSVFQMIKTNFFSSPRFLSQLSESNSSSLWKLKIFQVMSASISILSSSSSSAIILISTASAIINLRPSVKTIASSSSLRFGRY